MSAVQPSIALGSMVAKTWFRRPQSARVFSALAFVAVLVLTLGSSWRDGGPGGDARGGNDVNAELTAPAYEASADAIGLDLHSRLPFVLSAGSDLAARQARIPTARPVQL